MQAASEPPAPVFVQPPSVAATPNFILAPTVGWAPNQPPVSDGAPAYSLLEVIGRQLDLGPSIAGNTAMFPQGLHQEPRQAPYAPAGHDHGRQSQPPYGGPAPGSTFASLLAGVSGSPAAGPEAPNTAADPAAAPLPSPVLPAAAVTISLSEVLQLVAAGGPIASSPFDALRVAVRAPGSR